MKLYQSKVWLTKRYKTDGKSIETIAKECGVSNQTILNYLNKYELIRNPRTWKRG